MALCNIYYCEDPAAPYNVGDIFGPFLLKNLLEESVEIKINMIGTPVDQINPNFMIVGSVARYSTGKCIICGCGILLKNDNINDFLECSIVRGKHTLAKILECKPEYNNKIVLGDPGLVLPYFINAKPTSKKYKYGVILHYVDKKFNSYFASIPDVTIISIENSDILDLANKIMECEFIISSSLHGLVFADSLSIPSAWVRIKNTILTSDDIKFYDYYSIYDNIGVKPICTIVDTNELFDINKLHFNYIDLGFMMNKSAEIMSCIVNVIKKYSKINQKYDFIYNNNIGASVLSKQIESPNKFIVSRIGGLELDLYLMYKTMGIQECMNSATFSQMKKYAGYFDVNNNPANIEKYVQLFEKCYKNSQTVMIANSSLESHIKMITILNPYYTIHQPRAEYHPVIQTLLANKSVVSYHLLESFNYLNNWFSSLDGKKILIVSTFDNEIQEQLNIKDQLFSNHFLKKYPNFKSVEYVHTYLTLDDFEKPYSDWFETYNSYCRQIATKDFDIALVFCGCYAYPISNYIYENMHKSSIIVGGIGQLLFGIRGSRWETPYFQRLYNDKWTHRKLNRDVNGFASEGLNAYFVNN